MPKCLLFLIFLVLGAQSVAAQGLAFRQLPPKGDRGALGANQPLPQVIISGKVLRLSPGAVIYDQQNRMIVHANLPAQGNVFYTKDMNGDIQRMYILTAQESELLDRNPRK
jgi:hypothetical protein